MNRRFLIATALFALVGLAPAVSQAAERFLFPEDLPGPPIYLAVPENTLGFTDGEWACIPVYRQISGIPLDFNLLDHQDIPYAQSVPLYGQGFVIRDVPPPNPPRTLYIEDTPGIAMPILFVRWSELQKEIADGKLYIDELCTMDSLRIGIAEFYMEEIQVIDGAPIPSHRRVAFGEIAGRDSLFLRPTTTAPPRRSPRFRCGSSSASDRKQTAGTR